MLIRRVSKRPRKKPLWCSLEMCSLTLPVQVYLRWSQKPLRRVGCSGERSPWAATGRDYDSSSTRCWTVHPIISCPASDIPQDEATWPQILTSLH